MSYPRVMGRVSLSDDQKRGRIELADRTVLEVVKPGPLGRWLLTKVGKSIWLNVTLFFKRRSLNQNAYWWGVVVPMFAERCGYMTHEHDAVHDELMRVLCGLRPGSHPALQIRVSSADLSTAEFNSLIERAQVFAADKLGLVIPDPDPEYAFRR